MRPKPTRRLGYQLVASHLAVALVSLVTTGIVVWALAPWFFARSDHSPARGSGYGQQLIDAVHHALVWGLLAGALAAVELGLIAAWSISRSVRLIRDSTKRLAQGDYAARMPQTTTRELDELSRDIGTMASAVRDTEARRTRLISEVSHEMRTPLTVIDGQVEAMLDGVVPLDPDNLAPLLAESHRLRRLADDLSALSRAEEGRMGLELREADVCEVIETVVRRLHPQIEDAGIHLVCAPTAHAHALIDPDRIGQVITNLVGNAIRATPEGGTITITCAEKGDFVEVMVADTGVGIDEGELEKVFERFYRAGAGAGSGIGLTIARQIALHHGGSLTASSEGRGRGATFTLSLPAITGVPD